MALWFFQRTAPGILRRLSVPAMQRFLVGEEPLPHDGDGFVRCIGVSVAVEGRKPTSLQRLWFSKLRVQPDGTIDPHHRPSVIRSSRANGGAHRSGHGRGHAAASHAGQPGEGPGGAHSGPQPASAPVVSAEHLFAQRRLSTLADWRPEQADVDALRILVNGKAGRRMM